MNIFFIVLTIIVILSLFILYRISIIKDYDAVCNKAIDQISELLTAKEEKINDLLSTVKNKKINKLKKINDEMSVFEIEDILFNYRWEINKISIDEYLNDTELYRIIHSINLTDESIDGLKDFYNNNARKYNSNFNKLSWFYKLFKYEKKELFKFHKIDEYEILKS